MNKGTALKTLLIKIPKNFVGIFFNAVPLFTGHLNSTTIKNQKNYNTKKKKTIHFTFRVCIDQWTKLCRAVHVNMHMARCTPAPRVSPPPPILQEWKYGHQKFSRQE